MLIQWFVTCRNSQFYQVLSDLNLLTVIWGSMSPQWTSISNTPSQYLYFHHMSIFNDQIWIYGGIGYPNNIDNLIVNGDVYTTGVSTVGNELSALVWMVMYPLVSSTNDSLGLERAAHQQVGTPMYRYHVHTCVPSHQFIDSFHVSNTFFYQNNTYSPISYLFKQF